MLNFSVRSMLFCFVFLAFAVGASSARAASRTSDLTYDLGVSTGSTGTIGGNDNYTEVNLGLNWYAQDWLAWRNAIFGRWQTDVQTAYGLDTSLRLIAAVGGAKVGVTAFVAPGYRIAANTPSAPFAEEGLVLHLGGLSIGGGAKQIFDSWIHQGQPNDNQYFLILGGGGSL